MPNKQRKQLNPMFSRKFRVGDLQPTLFFSFKNTWNSPEPQLVDCLFLNFHCSLAILSLNILIKFILIKKKECKLYEMLTGWEGQVCFRDVIMNNWKIPMKLCFRLNNFEYLQTLMYTDISIISPEFTNYSSFSVKSSGF